MSVVAIRHLYIVPAIVKVIRMVAPRKAVEPASVMNHVIRLPVNFALPSNHSKEIFEAYKTS